MIDSETASAPATDGKHPITALAGPYGHPFHPILVTVPIGAWVAAVVFDVVSRAGDDAASFTKGAYWLVGIGIAGALAAALFGFLDLLAIPTGTVAFRTALVHMTLNLVVVAAFGVGFALRRGHLDDTDGTPVGLVALTVASLAVLGVAGWLGGRLTYRYGVRVVDEAAQTRRLHASLGGSMEVAALIVWIATALGGFVLLGAWVSKGGHRRDRTPPSRFPAGLVFAHFLLAAAGLVLWIAYVASDSEGLPWVAFGVLAVVAVLGFALFFRWLPQVRGAGAADAAPTAERQFPVPVVVVHGLAGATTLVLVLLAALAA